MSDYAYALAFVPPVFVTACFFGWSVLIALGRSRWTRATACRLIVITGCSGVLSFAGALMEGDGGVSTSDLLFALFAWASVWTGAFVWAFLVRMAAPGSYANSDGRSAITHVDRLSRKPRGEADLDEAFAHPVRDADGTWRLKPPA